MSARKRKYQDDHNHKHRHYHNEETTSRDMESDDVEDSEDDYDDDDSDSDMEHAWCFKCKKLIQSPVYQNHAHFHTSRFDMWLCSNCFPVPQNEPNVCKCILACIICNKDVLYDCDKCIPFQNTSRGFCSTCATKLKDVILTK